MGAVSNILKEAREKDLDLETLRDLLDTIRKNDIDVSSFIRGAKILSSMDANGTTIDDVGKAHNIIKAYGEEAGARAPILIVGIGTSIMKRSGPVTVRQVDAATAGYVVPASLKSIGTKSDRIPRPVSTTSI